MKKSLRWFGFLLLLFLAVAAPQTFAEDGDAPQETAHTAASEAPSSIAIVPHRAVYKMSLASVKNGSTVSDVSGKMLFDWSDACDGWAIEQHLLLNFQYAEGDSAEVKSTVVSWEAKNGKAYRFNVKRVTNGKETENYRGQATLGAQGGSGRYTIPKDKKEIALTKEAVFPSAHTVMILNAAQKGEKLFTRRVFDGSDEDGMADVSVFVGASRNAAMPDDMPASLKSNPLLKAEAWPVRLAYYKPDTETGVPDYEMDLVLQANGVARSMAIDYGDFVVAGTLVGIEPLSPNGCVDSKHPVKPKKSKD